MSFFLFFILGSCLSSFLLCQAQRWNCTTPPLRSQCDYCHDVLPFRSLIPLLSWCYQGGRSACCENKLSLAYPFVEVLGGCLGISFLTRPLLITLSTWLLFWMSLTDWYEQRISVVSIIGFLIFTGAKMVTSLFDWESLILCLIIPVFLTLYEKIFRKNKPFWGEGDKIIFGTMGAWIPLSDLSTFFVVSGCGILLIQTIRDAVKLKTDIPFMPSLLIAWIALLMIRYY